MSRSLKCSLPFRNSDQNLAYLLIPPFPVTCPDHLFLFNSISKIFLLLKIRIWSSLSMPFSLYAASSSLLFRICSSLLSSKRLRSYALPLGWALNFKIHVEYQIKCDNIFKLLFWERHFETIIPPSPQRKRYKPRIYEYFIFCWKLTYEDFWLLSKVNSELNRILMCSRGLTNITWPTALAESAARFIF
jgi:hypothetical protein